MADGDAPTAVSALSVSVLRPRILTPLKSSSATMGFLPEVTIVSRVM